MRQPAIASFTIIGLLAMAACAPSTRDLPPADSLSPDSGYYRGSAAARTPGREAALPGHYVALAFSGGGTRAAAFAHGVLRELDSTPAPGRPDLALADAVDMISSTSGGSVAGANFALHGRAGFRRLDAADGFLRHDGIADLAGNLLNPVRALTHAFTSSSRIEALADMMTRKVFGDATYGQLQQRAGERKPLLVLNAGDMASGERFSFTQSQLDFLCLDLLRLRIADAVTASAAFPVALTPVALPDHSPCAAQRVEMVAATPSERLLLQAGWTREDLAEICAGRRDAVLTRPQPARSRALRRLPTLNFQDCGADRAPDDARRVRYVHLLDGGIADNLGLDVILDVLTGEGDGTDPRVSGAIDRREVRHIVVIAVNARSQPATAIGRDDSTPGIASMLFATISAAIDGRSGGLIAQLETLQGLLRDRFREGGTPPVVSVIAIDFERIEDPRCREAFQSISTSWTNAERETLALQEMGAAMLRASPEYRRLARLPESQAQVAQARARQACARLIDRSSPANEPPPAFGNRP